MIAALVLVAVALGAEEASPKRWRIGIGAHAGYTFFTDAPFSFMPRSVRAPSGGGELFASFAPVPWVRPTVIASAAGRAPETVSFIRSWGRLTAGVEGVVPLTGASVYLGVTAGVAFVERSFAHVRIVETNPALGGHAGVEVLLTEHLFLGGRFAVTYTRAGGDFIALEGALAFGWAF